MHNLERATNIVPSLRARQSYLRNRGPNAFQDIGGELHPFSSHALESRTGNQLCLIEPALAAL